MDLMDSNRNHDDLSTECEELPNDIDVFLSQLNEITSLGNGDTRECTNEIDVCLALEILGNYRIFTSKTIR